MPEHPSTRKSASSLAKAALKIELRELEQRLRRIQATYELLVSKKKAR